MSLITGIIPQQAFELIRDRIGSIILDELANQFILSGDASLNANVFIERFIPFDKTEMPAVNVTLARGTYDGKTTINEDGTYSYSVDCFTSAKSTSSDNGDSLASTKLHRILGMCRAILSSPHYTTLGYERPYISRVQVSEINIAEPTKHDSLSVMMGRLTVTVKVPENVEALVPTLMGGYQTQVMLGLTDQGYIFSGENIPVPPVGPSGTVNVNNVFFDIVEVDDTLNVVVVDEEGNPVGSKVGNSWVVPAGGDVEIIDQEGTVIDTVSAPGSFQVLVFNGIDGGSPSTTYTNSIVAP